MAAFRPNARFIDIIKALGLTSNLKLCLDAGDSASYSSGQSWLDRSGNGYDFFRGTTSGSDATDPTFNGSAGGLSASEYFSFDGGDYFQYDSANETWMQNLHKDSARFTIASWFWPETDLTQSIIGDSNVTTGIRFRVSGSTNNLVQEVSNAGGGVLNVNGGGSLVSWGDWNFSAVSIDEPVGASGGLLVLNDTNSTFDATYVSPATGNATATMQIGGRQRSGAADQWFALGIHCGVGRHRPHARADTGDLPARVRSAHSRDQRKAPRVVDAHVVRYAVGLRCCQAGFAARVQSAGRRRRDKPRPLLLFERMPVRSSTSGRLRLVTNCKVDLTMVARLLNRKRSLGPTFNVAG